MYDTVIIKKDDGMQNFNWTLTVVRLKINMWFSENLQKSHATATLSSCTQMLPEMKL